MLNLEREVPSSPSLFSGKKEIQKMNIIFFDLLLYSGALAGHPRVAALPPEFGQNVRFSKNKHIFNIPFLF